MNGYPVVEARMLVTSPSVKHMVTAMIRPIKQLRYTDHIMAFGKVSEASWISSAGSNISFSTCFVFQELVSLAHMHRTVEAKQCAHGRE